MIYGDEGPELLISTPSLFLVNALIKARVSYKGQGSTNFVPAWCVLVDQLYHDVHVPYSRSRDLDHLVRMLVRLRDDPERKAAFWALHLLDGSTASLRALVDDPPVVPPEPA